jgi:predicted AAA+ superfamily ATPase
MQNWSKFADMTEIKRDINISETSFFLFGPRGTGKSTLLILLYRGSGPMKHKNIIVVPVEIFLKNPGQFL